MLWHLNTKLYACLLAAVWLCQEMLNADVTGLTKGWREEKERAASPLPLSISTCWACGARSCTNQEADLTSAPPSSFQGKATSS